MFFGWLFKIGSCVCTAFYGSESCGALLFHLMSHLYEKTSILMATNLSRRMGASFWQRQNDYGALGSHYPFRFLGLRFVRIF
jgi:hypothetical protein